MPRNRLGEDREDRPVFEIPGQEHRGGKDGEKTQEEGHGAERDVLEHLELFLERKPRQEGGASDHHQRKDEQEQKNFLADQIGERVPRYGKDP